MKKCAIPGCRYEAGIPGPLCMAHFEVWRLSAERVRSVTNMRRHPERMGRYLMDFVDRIDAEERNGSNGQLSDVRRDNTSGGD